MEGQITALARGDGSYPKLIQWLTRTCLPILDDRYDPKIRKGTISAHLIQFSTNASSRP